MTEQTQTSRFNMGRPRVRASAVIAIALLIGFVVWIFVRGGSSNTSPPVPKRATPEAISVAGLKALARAVGHPVYWVGPKPGYTYELSKASGDRIYVRYLPPGVQLGSDHPYLTIGTYAVPNAYSVSRDLSDTSGRVKVAIGNGGVAFYSKSAPTSVYFAYPGSDYQVEVYDPSPANARRLIASGTVRSVLPGAPSGVPEAVTIPKLRAVARSLRHPVYWAGNQAGVTYELRRTANGSVYVRYLPAGAQVGVDKPYLTVGTYPVKDAFTATRTQSRKPGSVLISAPAGGLAFYSKSRPTNVYLAFRGTDLQIEVYDPLPSRAKQLVTTGGITPVG